MKLKVGLSMMETSSMHSTFTSGSSWQRADDPGLFSAGSMPYVARDLMQFPVVEPADGTLDIVVQNLASRVPVRQHRHLTSPSGGAENDARGSSQSSQRPPILDTVGECWKGAVVPIFSLFFRLSKITIASKPIALRCWQRKGT